MAFRVELSDRAQADITAIYDWLRSQQAGDAGERWFVALREAITSLSTFLYVVPWLPKVERRRWRCASFCTAASRTSTESSFR